MEADRARLDAAGALDEHPRRPADHDLGDRRVAHDALERPQAERLVEDRLHHQLAVARRQDAALLVEQVLDDGGQALGRDAVAAGARLAHGPRAQVLDQRRAGVTPTHLGQRGDRRAPAGAGGPPASDPR